MSQNYIFPLIKLIPIIANIIHVKIITKPTLMMPSVLCNKAETKTFRDLFYVMNLKGLNVLNNLNILMTLRSTELTKISINDVIIIQKSNIFH